MPLDQTKAQQLEQELKDLTTEVSAIVDKASSAPTQDFPTILPLIEAKISPFLNEVVDAVPSSDLDDLIKLVRDRRAGLPLSTGITDQIVGISQQLLAFGAAGFALAIGFLDKIRSFSIPVQKYFAVFGIFYLELIIVSLTLLIVYMLQARFRYPFLYFREIGNAWPFFYYSSISPVPRCELQSRRARLRASEMYAKDLMVFANKCVTETKPAQLRNELQQYFLLMSFQGYVNQFSLRLASLFTCGFTGAAATAIVLFLAVGTNLL